MIYFSPSLLCSTKISDTSYGAAHLDDLHAPFDDRNTFRQNAVGLDYRSVNLIADKRTKCV